MSYLTKRAVSAAIYLGLASAFTPAGAISLGLANTFEGATTEGWNVAQQHPQAPIVVADGGPAGTGDGYMRLESVGGNSAGSRMAVNSGPEWDGNYLAAGIHFIEMDARNFGSTEMHLRVAFSTVVGGDYWVSAVPHILPAGSDWTHLTFAIDAASLTGAGNLSNLLSNVGDLRIFHNRSASFPPNGQNAIVASLGLDNITAVGPIPEPATVWMWSAAAGLLGLRTLSKRRARGA